MLWGAESLRDLRDSLQGFRISAVSRQRRSIKRGRRGGFLGKNKESSFVLFAPPPTLSPPQRMWDEKRERAAFVVAPRLFGGNDIRLINSRDNVEMSAVTSIRGPGDAFVPLSSRAPLCCVNSEPPLTPINENGAH